MLSDRGVEVGHTTLFRWVQTYAVTLEQRVRRHLRLWHRILAGGRDHHQGQGHLDLPVSRRRRPGPDVRLSAKRDAEAARRFFRKALVQPHVASPRTITVDKHPAHPRATRDMKRAGQP